MTVSSNDERSHIERDWAGSLPTFPHGVGDELVNGYELENLRLKRLLFGRLNHPGAVHVYSADCHAGGRIRVQSQVPVLSAGDGVRAAFAVVAQSLPYSADIHKLPLALPAGFSAVVAHPPTELVTPIQDRLTGVQYYPGPVIDTRTLVSGQCFIVVWSPQNKMGRYVLQVGHQWPLSWFYWLRTPLFWWSIRGWYGLSRAKAYLLGGLVLALAGLFLKLRSRRKRLT